MKKLLSSLVIMLLLTGIAAAQQAEVRKKQYNLEKSGLAIRGYDPVAYFTSHKAIEGKKEFTIAHYGVSYRFSNSQNLQLFKADPTKFEPQYGGWCAYAMGAKGEKVEIDPETFKIVNGKLYLFYNKLLTNTLNYWNKDEAKLKPNADRNWTKFVN